MRFPIQMQRIVKTVSAKQIAIAAPRAERLTRMDGTPEVSLARAMKFVPQMDCLVSWFW